MSKIFLITVGKLKDPLYEGLEKKYLKRINSPKISIIECRALEEDRTKEGKEVLKKISELPTNTKIILLTETGQAFNSTCFSKWLNEKLKTPIAFVIAGAAGPSEELKKKSHQELSLSSLTFPHRMARIILIEQIYRAQTIRQGHPYHK